MQVVDTFAVGLNPQHVVPSWDLKTLWVTNNAEGTADGTLTPIDPTTGKPGASVNVDDPYNMYFTPDGKSAIDVAEARKRLDFLDPHTMALADLARRPGLRGDQPRRLLDRRPLRDLHLRVPGQPGEDRHREPLGRRLPPAQPGRHAAGHPLVARRQHVLRRRDDRAAACTRSTPTRSPRPGFIPTGIGTHGLYPSRDGTKLYVANRGSDHVGGPPNGPGSVSVLDFATRRWSPPGPSRVAAAPTWAT